MKALSLRVGLSPLEATTGLAALIGSVLVGAALAQSPLALVPVAVAGLAVGAIRFPEATLQVSLVATTLHFGLFLHYRVTVAGVPLSLIDVLPPLVFLSALSLRAQHRAAETRITDGLKWALFLVAAGAAIGIVLGVSQSEASYQVLRIIRLEAGLLLLLLAAVIAAPVERWRRALISGLYWAGILSAGQILFTYAWSVGAGESFWARFPFGKPANLAEALASGNVNALQTIALSPYPMLPALALCLIRLRRNDALVASLLIVASAATLSRAFWIIALCTVLLVLGVRAIRISNPLKGVSSLAVVMTLAVAGLLAWSADFLEQRLDQSLGPQDRSADFRRVETEAAINNLTADPASFALGLGAGHIVEHSARRVGEERRSPILENSTLARWANLTLLSVLGVLLLAVASFRWAWRRVHTDPLAAMSLPISVVVAGGLFSNTLMAVIVTGPLWLMAGTALGSVGPARTADRLDARRHRHLVAASESRAP